MNIYFVIGNSRSGSSNLRAVQIQEKMTGRIENKITIIEKKQINKYEKALYIWVKSIDLNCINKETKSINIFDPIDNYVYKKKHIDNLLKRGLIDGLIVNSSYMKIYFKENLKFTEEIFAIHHHWDPCFDKVKKIDQDVLKFGYIGSIASLSHSNNFLHFKKLIVEYPIELIDTELCENVTNKILKGEKLRIKHNLNLKNIELNFNIHLSIRENESLLSNFKTTAKLATAAANNHNIITTKEKAILDIIPDDYPFLLESTDYETVINMFNLVIEDFNDKKELWNKGLKIMKEVKEKLSLDNVVKDYITMIKYYE